jgi:polysaccharide pyruvyl transferase WcaK-like protein
VGAGPLRHPMSRFFVKSALSLAFYRSYRDDNSRQYLCSIGFDASHDEIYPDLAFSMPTPKISQSADRKGDKPVVAVGVKDYYGQYDLNPHRGRTEDIYDRYLDQLSIFVGKLIERGFTVRFIVGDTTYDSRVKSDLRKALDKKKIRFECLQIIDEPIESMGQLVSQLAASDIVVTPRFHNVVISMLLNKPVIALAYHEKFAALMEGPDLARLSLNIDDLDSNELINDLEEVLVNSNKIKSCISRKVLDYRIALERQYAIIFDADKLNLAR